MSKNSPLIEVIHLTKKYGENAAVDDVSFEVYPGEIFEIILEVGS